MARMMAGMLFAVGIVLLIIGTNGRNASADPPKGKPVGPTQVALVDMAKIFKSSKMFNDGRLELKQQIDEAEDVAKKLQNEALQLKNKAAQFEKGTEERTELESQLKKKAFEFETFRKSTAEKFLNAESRIYREVYGAVTAEISSYSRTHDIDLVVRFDSSPLKDESPQKMLESMNRLVIYENGLDITEEIMAALK